MGNAEYGDHMRVGRPLMVQGKAGDGSEEDGLQTRASNCTLAPDLSNIGVAHKRHNTDHIPPLPWEGW